MALKGVLHLGGFKITKAKEREGLAEVGPYERDEKLLNTLSYVVPIVLTLAILIGAYFIWFAE